MMYLKRLNQNGSLSLTAIFSTASGLLFVMLFYNLAVYVGSRGALTEVARATARCITPTDPKCVSILPSNPEGIDFDWYARIPANGLSADVGVRTFRYQASMPSELWSAQFNYYSADIGEQRFNVNSALVPVKNFSSKGAYQIPSGVINASYNIQGSSEFSPKFNPNFPLFEQDRNMTAAQWLSTQNPFTFIANESGEIVINANSDFAFTTPAIQVPTIAAETSALCTGNCDTHELAGGTNSSWKDYAYLAIKVVSRVRAERGQTTFQWGERNNFAGLEVEVKDASGQTVTWTPEGSNLNLNWRCLGGADETALVGTSWRGYNLWLRGPKGSNGGQASSAVCPAGAYQHDAILVPRGGSFRVRAHLANSGRNRARANITVLSYFDEYINTTPANKLVECAARAYNGFDQEQATCSLQNCRPSNCNTAYCPTQSLQALSDAGLITAKLVSCNAQRQNINYSCSENAKTIPNSALTFQTLALAVCSDSWKPALSVQSRIDQETICSWQTDHTISGWQEVGAASCELAKASNYSETCETPFTESNSANLNNCKKLKDKLDQVSASTQDLNAKQIFGAPKFQNLASYNWGDLENIRAVNFWANKDLHGNALPESAQKTTQSLGKELAVKSFIRKDNTSTTPKPSDFLNAIKNSGIDAYGWEDFNPDNQISPFKLAHEDYTFSEVYPFNESSTEEIYYGQTDPTAGWDFEADCKPDPSCLCEESQQTTSAESKCQSFSSQEQMLRDFAAKEIPYAADPNYVFNSSATHVGFKDIGRYPIGNLPELPACFPTRAVCTEQKTDKDEIVYLGKSKSKPSECDNYSECFSKIPADSDLNIGDAEEVIDLELAKQVGMNELKRIVPYATLQEDCGATPACAEIEIDTRSKSKAVVQVKYNIPLNFPLSSMLQKDSVQVVYRKEEVIERDFAGSNLYK